MGIRIRLLGDKPKRRHHLYCMECGRVFFRRQSLSRHRRRKHPKGKAMSSEMREMVIARLAVAGVMVDPQATEMEICRMAIWQTDYLAEKGMLGHAYRNIKGIESNSFHGISLEEARKNLREVMDITTPILFPETDDER